MADIFISYAVANRQLAKDLATKLGHDGFDVWWSDNLRVGMDFQKEIQARIKSSRAVITIWTRESIVSDWVYAETTLANTKKIPVYFLLADDIEPSDIPLPFNARQFIGIEEYGRLRATLNELGSANPLPSRGLRAIRIVVDDPNSFLPMRSILTTKGNTQVSFAVRLAKTQREMEVRIPGRFDISPDRTAALHSLPGVLEIQEL